MAIRLQGKLGMGMDADGTLSLLAVAWVVGNPSLHAIQQVAPSDGWSNWISFPASPASSAISPPALAMQNFIDRQALTAYFSTEQNALGMQSRQPSWGDVWSVLPSPWPSSSTDGVSSVAVVGFTAERPTATLFVIDFYWQLWVTGGGSSGWTNLSSLPGAAMIRNDLTPAGVAASKDGRLEVFVTGTRDGHLYHLWETAVGGAWSDWFSHGAPAGHFLVPSPVLGTNQDGRLELFIVGTPDPSQGWGGPLFHIWQTAPSNGWSSWYSHGRPSNVDLSPYPTIARSPDGRLEVFAVGVDGNLYQIQQTAPNDGWSDWLMVPAPVGTSLIPSPVVGPSHDGRLELFVVGLDGNLYHRWQTNTVGSWSDWISHGIP